MRSLAPDLRTMLEPSPTVSVVIPVYNGADVIGPCLESLLRQRYPAESCEIIVVENGSTDNTTEVVAQYPVRLLHSEERGPAAARNLGIVQSQAEIVAFTDADCIADADWLVRLVEPYADPQIGGVGGAILAYTHGARNPVEQFSDQYSPLVNYMSGEGEFLPHLYTANASYRRDLLDEVGGFNPALITAEDVDLSWRVQLRTDAKLHYTPDAIIYHRHRATRAGLGRQYLQYGFGEIILDTLYGRHPGYPRTRLYQIKRIGRQILALPCYIASMGVRWLRFVSGRATDYEALVPRLWFLIESNNIRGKLRAIIATRFMRDARRALNRENAASYIRRFY